MANDMATSYKGAGQATGAAQGSQTLGRNFSPQMISDRATARTIKAQQDKELTAIKGTPYTPEDMATMSEIQSMQLDTALGDLQAAQAQNARTSTYSAFDRFEVDGSLGHLNTMLKDMQKNSVSRNMPGFSDIVKFDKIGPNDERLLMPLGLLPEDFEDYPELHQGYVKAITKTGEERLLPVEAMYASTGYGEYATERSLAQQERIAALRRQQQMSNASDGTARERTAHTMTELQRPGNIPEADWVSGQPEYDMAWIENYQGLQTERSTKDEREGHRVTNEQRPEDVAPEEWSPGSEAYDAAYNENYGQIVARNRMTTTQRNLEGVDLARQTIGDIATTRGENFFEINPQKDLETRLAYEPQIQRMMELGDLKFSNAERDQISYIHDLIELGNKSSDITPEETGILDRFFNNMGRYINDDVKGLAATSSYAAFRNTIRHALYGSTLTDGEIAAFKEQMGSLGQQAGPVLEQFKTAVTQVRSQLESLSNLNDSYVSHFYLGDDLRGINEMIMALDERIEMIDNQIDTSDVVPRMNPRRNAVQTPDGNVVDIDPQNFSGSEGASALYQRVNSVQLPGASQ